MATLKKSQVFDFDGYKDYVLHWISTRPNSGRGERSKIAVHLRCQLAYVSQVLAASAHFSLEQAEALNHFMGHTNEEAEYFLLLVQADRAGTADLRKRAKMRMKEMLDRRKVLKNRLEFEDSLSRENQMIYYSAWYYAAAHVALAVPGLNTRENLARELGLSPAKTAGILAFLVGCGLAREIGGRFTIGDTRLHLENDSPMVAKHHTNWRMKSIQSLESERAEDLHYSSIITVAAADAPKIREALVRAVEEVRGIVRPSRDEEVHCYTIDFFAVAGASGK